MLWVLQRNIFPSQSERAVTEPVPYPTVILFLIAGTELRPDTVLSWSTEFCDAQLLLLWLQPIYPGHMCVGSQTPSNKQEGESNFIHFFTLHFQWKLAESDLKPDIILKYLFKPGPTLRFWPDTVGHRSGIHPLVEECRNYQCHELLYLNIFLSRLLYYYYYYY